MAAQLDSEKVAAYKCAFYKNPFIRNIYGIGDKRIDQAFMQRVPAAGMAAVAPTRDPTNISGQELVVLRGDFKGVILPHMMKFYKNKYDGYCTLNGVVSMIVYLSDYYRQFSGFHMNAEFNPTLIEINRLIESENKIKSNKNKDSNVDKVIGEMTSTEKLYFEKNSALKTRFRDLFAFMSTKYYSVFREYSSFLYNYYLTQYNMLQKYKDRVDQIKKVVSTPAVNQNATMKRLETDLENSFSELVKVLPSEVTEAIPSKISEITGLRGNNRGQSGEESTPLTEMMDKIRMVTNLIGKIAIIGYARSTESGDREKRQIEETQGAIDASMKSETMDELMENFGKVAEKYKIIVGTQNVSLEQRKKIDFLKQIFKTFTTFATEKIPVNGIQPVFIRRDIAVIQASKKVVDECKRIEDSKRSQVQGIQNMNQIISQGEADIDDFITAQRGVLAVDGNNSIQSKIVDTSQIVSGFIQAAQNPQANQDAKNRAIIAIYVTITASQKLVEFLADPVTIGKAFDQNKLSELTEVANRLQQEIFNITVALLDILNPPGRAAEAGGAGGAAVARNTRPDGNEYVVRQTATYRVIIDTLMTAYPPQPAKKINEVIEDVLQILASKLRTDFSTYNRSDNKNEKLRKYLVSSSGSNSNTNNASRASPKVRNLIEILQKIKKNVDKYGRDKTSLQGKIQAEEERYRAILKAYDEALRSEKEEERAYMACQKARALFYGKVKELGGGIEDRKFTSIKDEYNDAYDAYITKVNARIQKYTILINEINKPQLSSNGNGNSFTKIDLSQVFTNENINPPYNFFKDNGTTGDDRLTAMDEGKLNIERIKRLRIIEKLMIEIESNARAEIEKMEQTLIEFTQMKKEAEDELTIIKGQKESINANSAAKREELASLKSEKEKVNGKYEALVTKISGKEGDIARAKSDAPELRQFDYDESTKIEAPDFYMKVASYKTKGETEEEIENNYKQIIGIFEGIEPDTTPYARFSKDNTAAANNAADGGLYGKIYRLFAYHKVSTASEPTAGQIEKAKEAFKRVLDGFITKHIYQPNNPNTIKVNQIDVDTKTAIMNELGTVQNPNKTIELYTTFKKEWDTLYNTQRTSLTTKDDLTRYRKISTGYVTLKEIYAGINALEKQKGDLFSELDSLKARIASIEDAPRRITAIYLAKKAYADRFPVLLKTFEEIMSKKVKYNGEVLEMIKSFDEMADVIYQILMKREGLRSKAEKKQNIQSSIYEAFNSDPLYKLIKTTYGLIQDDGKAFRDLSVTPQIMSSIQSYITGRNERFTKAGAIINTSEINSKRHVLQTMIEMMKGVKIGSFAVPVSVDSKKVVEKMERRDIDEVSVLLSNISSGKLTAKDESIRSFPKKFGKYFEDANSAAKPTKSSQQAVQMGGANAVPVPISNGASTTTAIATPSTSAIPPSPSNSAVALASTSNKVTADRSKLSIFASRESGNNSSKNKLSNSTVITANSKSFFMEMIYEMLLTQGDERINMVVNKLKETEQYLLKIAALYLDVVKIGFNGSGNDKITAQLETIKGMCKKVTKDLETELVKLMKRITTTKELINIRLITEYIYMEVILVYIISYFIRIP